MGGFILGISPSAGGTSSFESGERIQKATVRNLCPYPVIVTPWQAS